MAVDKYLFLGANTADGFVGFYDQLADLHNLKKLYILKGGSGIGKSTFIRKFAEAFKTYDRDFLVCSGDPKSLDGVIIHTLGIGVVDGTFPHPLDPIYPGVIDEIINLGEYIDFDKVKVDKQTLKTLSQKKSAQYKKAYKHLAIARDLHHKIESFYKNAVDFDSIEKRLQAIISKHR
jgi:hypothetical protein